MPPSPEYNESNDGWKDVDSLFRHDPANRSWCSIPSHSADHASFFQLPEPSAQDSRIELRVWAAETAETVDMFQPNISNDKQGPFATQYSKVGFHGTGSKEFLLDILCALSWQRCATGTILLSLYLGYRE